MAEHDLGGEAGAEVTITWQRLPNQARKHAALSGGLITDDNDAGQGHQIVGSTRKEPVNLLKHQRLSEAMLFGGVACHSVDDGKSRMGMRMEKETRSIDSAYIQETKVFHSVL